MDKILIEKKKYIFDYENGFFKFFVNGGKLATFPFSVRLVLSDGTVCEAEGVPHIENDKVVLEYQKLPTQIFSATFTMTFSDDEILSEFSATAAEDIYVDSMEFFRKNNKGMSMNDRTFSFVPAPRGADGHGSTLYKFSCDCSMNGYFAPAPSVIVCGNRFGKISWSLLDLPDSSEFRLSDRLGVLAEKRAGHLKTARGETYSAPRLLITFPEDEWEALETYYKKLKEKNIINPIRIEEKNYPDWWKRFVVDSYGDQIVEFLYSTCSSDDWASPDYNQNWLYEWLESAEKRLGTCDFNIVIDAYWQHEGSLDPSPDKNRFPDLRKFIDYAHSKGIKVILWINPFCFDGRKHLSETELTLAQKYGIIKKNHNFGTCIDTTHDNFEAYLSEFCKNLFSPEYLDADGVKIDGPFLMSNPASEDYAHPEKGIGAKEMLRYIKLFTKKAKEIKPDVLINTTTVSPFFEDYIHICRLGDQSVREEREERARICSLTTPNMLLDSDSVLDSELIKEDYLAATIYSVPYLYNVRGFLYGDNPSDETMHSLGALLSLCAKKPWGRPVFKSHGNWEWETNGKITAACFDHHTIMVFSEEGICYVFSWKDGEQTLPLYGWTLEDNPEATQITINLTAGKISAFKFN